MVTSLQPIKGFSRQLLEFAKKINLIYIYIYFKANNGEDAV